MTYRHDIAFPYEQAYRHFFSGLNDPGEIDGALRSGVWIGITCDEIRQGIPEAIENAAGSPAGLFIDSGAFGEIDFHPGNDAKHAASCCRGGPPTVNKKRELHRADWERVFEVYLWAADLWRAGRLYVVAPDRIANQEHTLMLQTMFRLHVGAVEDRLHERSEFANIIVPVQKGAMSMGDFFKAECEILELRDPIAGIPMKKDATSPEELYEFAETTPFYGTRFHLLGKGPASPGYDELIYTLKAIRPQCTITSDSTHRRWIGRNNGPKDPVTGKNTRRIYTAASDEARELGMRGSKVKDYAMSRSTQLEYEERMRDARERGWYDVELEDGDE